MAGGRLLRCGIAGLFLAAALAAGAEPAVDEGAGPVLKHSEALLSTGRLAEAGHYLSDSAAVIAGRASYYSRRLQGRLVATGEVFRNELLTAASNLFPLGSWLAVRRADGGCVVVRVNDRMHGRQPERILDLSYAAARHLNMIASGVAAVEARLLPAGFDRRRDDCGQAFSR